MRAVSAILALAVVVGACGAPVATIQRQSTDVSSPMPSEAFRPTITIGFATAPETLDPAVSCAFVSDSLVQNLYDKLVEVAVRDGRSDSSEIVPQLAESWEISDDGTLYTFHLRKNATFANGNLLTAEDVVYSLERILRVNGCTAYILTGGMTDNVESIQAVDEQTVQITLRVADPLFLLDLTNQVGILEKAALEANGGNSEAGDEWLSANTAGSGPFTLESYQPDSEIILAAREDYWAGPPGAKQLVLRIINDPSTMEVLVTSGDLDLAFGIPERDLDRIGQVDGLKVLSEPALEYVNIGINVGVKPLDDVRVRQALSYATPIEQIISNFVAGHARPLVGPILSGQLFYTEYPNPYGYDLEKARSLLAEAGVTDLALTMVIKDGETVQEEIATVIQASWSEIGVDLEVKTLGSSAFFDEVGQLKHQLYMIDDKSSSADPGFLLGYFVRCGDPFNWTAYCNEDVDAWLDDARTSLDSALRADRYDRVSRQVIDDAPYIQLYQRDASLVAAESLEGYVFYDDTDQRFYGLTK